VGEERKGIALGREEERKELKGLGKAS